MKHFITSILMAFLCVSTGLAYQYTFDGTAAGRYPIVMEVDRNGNGPISGRYAYKSTLKSKGRNNSSSWLYISSYRGSKSDYIITDSQGNIQEYWTDVLFWKENGVNCMSVSVENIKGRTFTINVQSQSKNTSTWTGTYKIISSGGYRSCPPPIDGTLTLTSNSNGIYKGTWTMTVRYNSDRLSGDVVGKLNNGVMYITLNNVRTSNGDYGGCWFERNDDYYQPIESGKVIAKITKNGNYFKILPEGNMRTFLSGSDVDVSIVKVK
ncbi:MAG: hypothetical protein HDS31_03455 [Bacteroides sp.]|nr:hypothetical protein [Bacteroides sp.]